MAARRFRYVHQARHCFSRNGGWWRRVLDLGDGGLPDDSPTPIQQHGPIPGPHYAVPSACATNLDAVRTAPTYAVRGAPSNGSSGDRSRNQIVHLPCGSCTHQRSGIFRWRRDRVAIPLPPRSRSGRQWLRAFLCSALPAPARDQQARETRPKRPKRKTPPRIGRGR